MPRLLVEPPPTPAPVSRGSPGSSLVPRCCPDVDDSDPGPGGGTVADSVRIRIERLTGAFRPICILSDCDRPGCVVYKIASGKVSLETDSYGAAPLTVRCAAGATTYAVSTVDQTTSLVSANMIKYL